jgi:chromosomal replication initiator protein
MSMHLFVQRLGVDLDCDEDLTAQQIIRRVASKHRVGIEEMLGPTRRRPMAYARQEAMWRLRRLRRQDGAQRFSYPQIAHLLGREDHTTVIYGVKAYEQRMVEAGKADRARWEALGSQEAA